MAHLGDFDAGDMVDLKFTTVTTTGAPTQLAGTPAISVYKDNSTTQTTTGVTLTVDFDTITGLNHVRIDTSADGTFYAAGSDFTVVITTGTVGGTSVVGYVVGSFSIRNRAALYPTTAGRTLDVSAGGEAGVDWANVGSPTTAVNLSGTTVGTVSALAAGSITAAVIATGAIDADALAADAAAEIADAVWDEARAGHVAAGSFGEYVLADAVRISGDDVAANNLEAVLDGTGGVTLVASAFTLTTPITANATQFAGTAYATALAAEVDAVWDEALTNAAHSTPNSAAVRLRALGSTVASTVNDATPSSTNFDTNLSGYSNDWFNDCLIRFTSGSLAGQTRAIYDFVGTGGVVTVDEAFDAAPANGDAFDVILTHVHTEARITAGVWDEDLSLHTNSGSAGERLGRVPNIAAGSAGGLFIAGSNAATTFATLTVSGATTLTGAVTASNASNNIVGIDVAKVNGTAQTAGDLAALLATIDNFLDTEIADIKTVTDQLTAAQAEPSAVPAANATPLQKLAWLAALARNKITQTATTQTLLADDGTTPVATSAVSDDATTFTRGEWT